MTTTNDILYSMITELQADVKSLTEAVTSMKATKNLTNKIIGGVMAVIIAVCGTDSTLDLIVNHWPRFH